MAHDLTARNPMQHDICNIAHIQIISALFSCQTSTYHQFVSIPSFVKVQI